MAHPQDVRALTLEGAKAMAEAAERLVAAAGVAALRGNP